MTTTTTQRRDRKGHFIKVCNDLSGCSTKAQWGIEGFGAFGIYHAHRATQCKRHAEASVKRMNGDGSFRRRGTYRAVKVER